MSANQNRDASTALDYAKSLRIMTDISNRTTFVTLYQAGEGIYEVMDKVIVIDQGHCVYQGPAREARQYFIDLGFHCPERQTTADFLTAVTDATERQYRDGYESKAPKTPEELEQAFRQSDMYRRLTQEITDYEEDLKKSEYIDAKEFEGAVRESKSKTVRKKSPFTVSFIRQVLTCTQREFWLTWGDKTTLYTKFFIILSNALIVGSLFYGQSLDTSGAFSRGGSLFFSILFLGWLQLSELMKAVSGRDVVKRHEDFAFYHPSAVSIARVLQDFPLILLQVIPFGKCSEARQVAPLTNWLQPSSCTSCRNSTLTLGNSSSTSSSSTRPRSASRPYIACSLHCRRPSMMLCASPVLRSTC
jgi:ATP-binding cassette subfamily G (WHITE) protein 2 (SNQ2)